VLRTFGDCEADALSAVRLRRAKLASAELSMLRAP
jgi:hypothetical protein